MADRHGVQKRKRHEIAEEDLQTRIGGKIHHEKKEVRKAAKKAKAFETQKVVKRLKELRTKSAEDGAINKFEAELVSLKIVDHDTIGDSAFMSKILKDYKLRLQETVVAVAKQELESQSLVPPEQGTAAARIRNRLLSSKILSAQVAASINSLKILLDPDAKRRKVELSRVESDTLPPKKMEATVPGRNRVDEEDLDSELAADNASWSSGTIDGEGVDDDDDVGRECGSNSSPDSPRQPIDESDSDESGELDGGNHGALLTRKNHRDAPNSKAADKNSSSVSQSTFLPSLSVGFIKGSDDSEYDEGDGRTADMPRKNRRGQRARRLIWEKKYGRNANHKKKEALERATFLAKKMLKDQKSTKKTHPATGANVTKPSTNERIPRRWPSTAQGANDHSAVSSHNSKRDMGAKGLHPSWEAKRKLKEKDRAAIVPSQGKKITF